MVVDGKYLAEQLLSDIASRVVAIPYTPKLGVVTCVPDSATRQYLELKQRKARSVGIELVVLELHEEATTVDCVAATKRLAETCHGVLVQLPLPAHIDRETVLMAIPVDQDPDGFAYGRTSTAVLPPVAGAIDCIANTYQVDWQHKKVVVVGNGRLVGQPAAHYANDKGAVVLILTEDTADYAAHLKTADIIISGVGKPHFITLDMVQDGVVVFDAGASEDGGQVVGDVHPNVAEKASLFTPVPGGIGPVTVAVLLDNMLSLVARAAPLDKGE
jgi:methylenetetrahydrofolate dehydrogenase (NADP+)/methenyltetrahydrofolate cyclohydrolase